MADGNIMISSDAVRDILRRIRFFHEEVTALSSQCKRAVDNAEALGWKDKSYSDFNDRFKDAFRDIENGLRKCEDELIPDLIRINNAVENF